MTEKTPSQIDLNTADENVLVNKLKISPRLARRIIALRPYQSVDQLNKVWGISPEVLQSILPLVSVNQPEILPDIWEEEIPIPVETALPPKIIEQEPLTDTQISKPEEAAIHQNEPELPPAVQPPPPIP